jgi:hypothetical protein
MPDFASKGDREMKSLACSFGRHRWETHTEQGEEYRVCSRCGKMPKELTTDSYAEARAAGLSDFGRQEGGGGGP